MRRRRGPLSKCRAARSICLTLLPAVSFNFIFCIKLARWREKRCWSKPWSNDGYTVSAFPPFRCANREILLLDINSYLMGLLSINWWASRYDSRKDKLWDYTPSFFLFRFHYRLFRWISRFSDFPFHQCLTRTEHIDHYYAMQTLVPGKSGPVTRNRASIIKFN